MPMLDLPGLSIEHAELGSGPPVVLVHGSASGNRQWRKLMTLLAADHHALAPNLRGYGATTPWDARRPQTLADAAEVVLALCERLDGPLRLVGHSWGGAAALWAAARLGPRVSHLVLHEPMLAGLLRGPGAEAEEMRSMLADVRRLGGAGDWPALAARFTDYFNGDGAWAATAPERRAAIAAALPPNVFEWEASVQPMQPADFDGVAARRLLLRGPLTRPALRAMTDLLGASDPRWAVEELPAGGHMAPLTHPELFNRRVADFLREPA